MKSTTTTMTKRQNSSDERTNEHRIEAEIVFEKPNPIVDRTPAKQPKSEEREGEALTSPGNPLTNITTIKLSRKKTEDFEPKVCVCVCFKVCFVRFIQISITLTSLDPTHKDEPGWQNSSLASCLEAGLWLKLTVQEEGGLLWWSRQRKRF